MAEEAYVCQHGGPGELAFEEKKLFLTSYQYNIAKLHKQLVRAQYNEILASELVILEEILKANETLRNMVDGVLVRTLFSTATEYFLKGKMNESQIHARAAVYCTMYIQHGERLWELTHQPTEQQQVTLKDMYTGLAQIRSDTGLPNLLNTNAGPNCTCLERALPNLPKKTVQKE